MSLCRPSGNTFDADKKLCRRTFSDRSTPINEYRRGFFPFWEDLLGAFLYVYPAAQSQHRCGNGSRRSRTRTAQYDPRNLYAGLRQTTQRDSQTDEQRIVQVKRLFMQKEKHETEISCFFGGAKQPKSEPLPSGASLAAISSKVMVFVPSL